MNIGLGHNRTPLRLSCPILKRTNSLWPQGQIIGLGLMAWKFSQSFYHSASQICQEVRRLLSKKGLKWAKLMPGRNADIFSSNRKDATVVYRKADINRTNNWQSKHILTVLQNWARRSVLMKLIFGFQVARRVEANVAIKGVRTGCPWGQAGA